jgi:hypothetical protein
MDSLQALVCLSDFKSPGFVGLHTGFLVYICSYLSLGELACKYAEWRWNCTSQVLRHCAFFKYPILKKKKTHTLCHHLVLENTESIWSQPEIIMDDNMLRAK